MNNLLIFYIIINVVSYLIPRALQGLLTVSNVKFAHSFGPDRLRPDQRCNQTQKQI